MASSAPIRIQAKRELTAKKASLKMAKGKILSGPRTRKLRIRA